MKRAILVSLLAVGLLLGLIPLVVSSQGGFTSWRSINMAGVSNSFLTIEMEGIDDTRLLINQIIIIPELTGMHVYPISCSFGLIRPGDVKSTGLVFEILNASNTTLNVTIAVQGDWAGSTNWTHSDDCIPGVDTAGLVAIVQGSSSHTAVIVRKSEPYNYIVTGLGPRQTCAFGLQLYAPTSFTDYSSKSNSIFISSGES